MSAMDTMARSGTSKPAVSRARRRRLAPGNTHSALLLAMLLTGPAIAQASNHFVEEFDHAAFKDARFTYADWDTSAGTLHLFEFQSSLLGNYDSPGTAGKVATAGSVAYVADGASGLRLVNVSNPAAPVSLGNFDTSGNANDVVVAGTVAYVADGASGLQIINVSNPGSPALLGTFNTSGDARAVAISGSIAYVADGVSGLQIINVNNSASPSLLGTYDTPGNARGVAISGRTAYVADDAPGLQIINVTTSASPVLLGTFDTPGLAAGVAISGSLAGVADELSGLQIIDVTNPASPALSGTCNTPGDAVGVTFSGAMAYVADAASGLQVVDLSTPATPALLETFDTAGSAGGVSVLGTRAYVADGSSGLQIIRVGHDPPQPTQVGTCPDLYWVRFSGTRAYGFTASGVLQVLDVSDPVHPVLLGTCGGLADPWSSVVSGTMLYVGDYYIGLKIFDVSIPASPALVGTFSVPGVNDVAISGTTAYVVDGFGLKIIDVSNPASPSLLARFAPDCPGDEYVGVAVSGTVAYIASGTCGLTTVDVSNPRSPGLLAIHSTAIFGGGFASQVAVSGSLAWVAQPDVHVLLLLNVSNPANPTQLGACLARGAISDFAISGNIAYLANGSVGLDVFDFSDPAQPALVWTDNTPSDDVEIRGTLAYVQGPSGLRSLDIDDPVSSIRSGVCDVQGSGTGPGDIAVSGTLAYLTDLAAGLKIVDISNPAAPVLRGGYDTPGNAYGVAVSGTVAYVADAAFGLEIFNVSNPASPALLGTYDTPGVALDVAVSGTVAYVADAAAGLQIINVSNPASPALLGTYNTSSSAAEVVVSGTTAYVADGTSMQIINVSNSASPSLVGVYNDGANVADVAISGSQAFLLGSGTPLRIVNVGNPASPSLLGTFSQGTADDIAVSGTLGYAANPAGLQVIDVGDPANVRLLGLYPTSVIRQVSCVAISGSMACAADPFARLNLFEVLQQRFDTPRHLGQSPAVNGALGDVRRARLTSTQSGNVGWALSGDGGVRWEPVTPGGYWVTFENAQDLRWQAVVLPAAPSLTSVPPAVSRLDIEWLGSSPAIETVADIPGDQGGKVRLEFQRSGYDLLDETLPAIGYTIYHRVDDADLARRVHSEGVLPARTAAAASLPISSLRVFEGRTFVLGGGPSTGSFPAGTWEAVGYLGATQNETYTALLPTTADSTVSGTHWSAYLVTVHTNDPETWFVSRPESGYSADNLAPAPPPDLALPGSGALSWSATPDRDFDYFTVYGSSRPVLDSTAVMVTQTSGTSAAVTHGTHAYYHVTVTDFAGNEGNAASVNDPAVTPVAAGGEIPSRFCFYPHRPNPTRGATSFWFDLPAAARVDIGVYDAGGRAVARLGGRPYAAGSHRVDWQGADDTGHALAPGVYFVRIRAGEISAARRLLIAR